MSFHEFLYFLIRLYIFIFFTMFCVFSDMFLYFRMIFVIFCDFLYFHWERHHLSIGNPNISPLGTPTSPIGIPYQLPNCKASNFRGPTASSSLGDRKKGYPKQQALWELTLALGCFSFDFICFLPFFCVFLCFS